MSQALRLVLVTPPRWERDDPTDRRDTAALRSVARAVRPGDALLVVERGGHPAERHFAEIDGWRAAADLERITLDPGACAEDAAAARAGRDDRPALLVHLGDVLVAEALDRLRALMARSPGLLWITNHAWQVAGPHLDAAIPCADAGRWPRQAGPGRREDAACLRQDRFRLVPFGAGSYAARIAAADALGFLPDRLVLRPPPAGESLALLAQSPAEADLPAHLRALDDAIALIDPLEVEAFLAAATGFLATLPRRARRVARGHDGPGGRVLDALARRRRAEALAELALAMAATDRAMTRALCAETARLGAALDLALPGPDYLRRIYGRLRGL